MIIFSRNVYYLFFFFFYLIFFFTNSFLQTNRRFIKQKIFVANLILIQKINKQIWKECHTRIVFCVYISILPPTINSLLLSFIKYVLRLANWPWKIIDCAILLYFTLIYFKIRFLIHILGDFWFISSCPSMLIPLEDPFIVKLSHVVTF